MNGTRSLGLGLGIGLDNFLMFLIYHYFEASQPNGVLSIRSGPDQVQDRDI